MVIGFVAFVVYLIASTRRDPKTVEIDRKLDEYRRGV
jgi:hypothetical protein